MEMKLLKFLNLVSIPVLCFYLIKAQIDKTPLFWIVAFVFGLIVAVYNVVNEP